MIFDCTKSDVVVEAESDAKEIISFRLEQCTVAVCQCGFTEVQHLVHRGPHACRMQGTIHQIFCQILCQVLLSTDGDEMNDLLAFLIGENGDGGINGVVRHALIE